MKKLILSLLLSTIIFSSVSFFLKESTAIKYDFNFELVKENDSFILSKNIDIINSFILLVFVLSFGLYLRKKEKEI